MRPQDINYRLLCSVRAAELRQHPELLAFIRHFQRDVVHSRPGIVLDDPRWVSGERLVVAYGLCTDQRRFSRDGSTPIDLDPSFTAYHLSNKLLAAACVLWDNDTRFKALEYPVLDTVQYPVLAHPVEFWSFAAGLHDQNDSRDIVWDSALLLDEVADPTTGYTGALLVFMFGGDVATHDEATMLVQIPYGPAPDDDRRGILSMAAFMQSHYARPERTVQPDSIQRQIDSYERQHKITARDTSVSVVHLRTPEPPPADPTTARSIDWRYQWEVRGFDRMQAYGPGRSLRRKVHVDPFRKGPKDKPLKQKVYHVSR